ncbi:hypothetical protein N0V93_009759 [Gnomoniopsis smithogilvyi]|uniref:Uncharacterized protein n=1 Tax=Gnomoniopsis smithogilvyi TaxID=1191159 RepID=A0A9W9CT42_9PEZI|nr:hypothetical protein N0V93_009759 [Gnomoniopsis smithogilvyi]
MAITPTASATPLHAQLASNPKVLINAPEEGAPSSRPKLIHVDAIPIRVPIRFASVVSRVNIVGCKEKKAPVKNPYRITSTKRPAACGSAFRQSTSSDSENTDVTIMLNGPRHLVTAGMLGRILPGTDAALSTVTRYAATPASMMFFSSAKVAT